MNSWMPVTIILIAVLVIGFSMAGPRQTDP